MLETVESILRHDGEGGISEGLDEMGHDERPEPLDEGFDFTEEMFDGIEVGEWVGR